MTAQEILKALSKGRELQLENKYIGKLMGELAKQPGEFKIDFKVNRPRPGVTTLTAGHT